MIGDLTRTTAKILRHADHSVFKNNILQPQQPPLVNVTNHTALIAMRPAAPPTAIPPMTPQLSTSADFQTSAEGAAAFSAHLG